MEKELADHLSRLDDIFYGLTRRQVRSFAFEFAEKNHLAHSFNMNSKMAGKKWFLQFCARNNFSLRTPEKISAARVSGFNRNQVELFFDNLKTLMETYKFRPQDIYNMDESGVSVVPHKMDKIVTTKGKKMVSKVVAAEKGETCTLVACMNVLGFPVPPGLIIPRVRHHEKYYRGCSPGTLQLHSESGFMKTPLFLQWLEHFKSYAKPSAEQPVLLILDNHASHINVETINFCRQNFIHLLSLPPHTTDRLQPLDRCFFGPFKGAYATLVANFAIGKKEYETVKMENIAELVHQAYSLKATMTIAQSGFSSTGIYPYNPSKFMDEHFLPSTVTDGKLLPISCSLHANLRPNVF